MIEQESQLVAYAEKADWYSLQSAFLLKLTFASILHTHTENTLHVIYGQGRNAVQYPSTVFSGLYRHVMETVLRHSECGKPALQPQFPIQPVAESSNRLLRPF